MLGKYNFDFDDQDLWIDFECHINHPGESWLRLRYQICDSWTGETHDIDELIYLVARRAYGLVYGSQRETVHDRVRGAGYAGGMKKGQEHMRQGHFEQED